MMIEYISGKGGLKLAGWLVGRACPFGLSRGSSFAALYLVAGGC